MFDDEKARRFLYWMTQFKHTKGPLQGENIVPEPEKTAAEKEFKNV
ncbi:hypothetical protein [Bacillus subtilis]|nr:hypothetical protein [Bacillus subtilis]